MKPFVVLASLALALAAAPSVARNSGGKLGGGVAACALSDLSPAASACTGFFAGNLLSGNPGNILAQQAGLAPLGLVWDGNFGNVTKINSLGGGGTINWANANQNPVPTMFGTTWVGLHYGNGSAFGNATAFYRFDAGAGLQSFMLNMPTGSSGAVMYLSGKDPRNAIVPEPESWVLLIAGFGLVGATMRRKRVVSA
jgi:hypothetical protein